jgi:FMN phosphatase YigB (HAD superfamily)
MVRFIFFDLGNVLLRFNVELMLDRGALALGCSVLELRQLIYGDGWVNRLETGKINETEFFEIICKRFRVDSSFVEIVEVFNDIFTEVIEIRPFLEHLSRINFPRGILSNTSWGHWNHIISKFNYLTKLIPDNHVLSCSVKSMKPEREIFEYAMRIAQNAVENGIELKANEILFIDDLKQNIEGATIFGFDTIQFTNWQNVNNELKKRNLIQ